MIKQSTIQLLRFHFSIFLLPVFLFAISQIAVINKWHTLGVFLILHVLVYPSSNGYNSYMDRDTSAIGGLQKPMLPSRQLFYVSCIMDVVAIIAGLCISVWLSVSLLIYILASRAYSYRGIRLKKYPIIGYLTVTVFQGAFTFAMVYYACSAYKPLPALWICLLASSCLIGGYYPLTQIYQFEEDEKDNVQTISMFLGKKGTFVFCGIIFTIAAICMADLSYIKQDPKIFYLFALIMSPVILFFVWWMNAVWRNPLKANFRYSLMMNVIASCCTSFYFLTLIFLKN